LVREGFLDTIWYNSGIPASDRKWLGHVDSAGDNSMKPLLPPTLLLFCGMAACSADEFESPVRLEGEGAAVRVESPGYAAPCWADIDGDDKKDLLVGQFNQGKIRIYRNLGDGNLAAGDWLQAEGEVAEVPGVW
jgi:hypothetical protein